ncbi:MAG: CBS domain-containing protein [Planctomycetaceae bacterium]|nr:CBS domain-containing protein [Planctomycetaceae bacterium]
MEFSSSLATDPVRSLPLREPPRISGSYSASAAIAAMRDKELGCAVIVDDQGIPEGIFTERSVIQILSEGRSLDVCTVRQCADSHFVVVREEDPVSVVWNAICNEHTRFVCVTDAEGKLVGLTGQRGMSEYVSECFPWQVAVQRLGATPWDQQREGA